VRTIPIEALCAVAVEAQHLKAGGIVVFKKPSVELVSGLAVDHAAMLLASAFDVIDREKLNI
jgi:hypothetical protein